MLLKIFEFSCVIHLKQKKSYKLHSNASNAAVMVQDANSLESAGLRLIITPW